MSFEYPLTIEVKPDPRTMVRAALLNQFGRWWSKLAFVMVVFWAVFLVAIHDGQWSTLKWLALALVVFYSVFVAFIVFVWPYIQYARTAPMQQPIEYRFYPDRMESRTSAGEGSGSWLYRVAVSSQLLLLYVNSSSYAIVPRTACQSDEEFREVARICQTFAEHK